MAFTILELMVAISIIAVLMSLIAPALMNAREQARRTQCMNNLRQIGIGLHGFHSAQRRFPDGNIPNRLWTFQSQILPYLDRTDLFDRIDYNFPDYCFFYGAGMAPPDDPRPVAVSVFACPSDDNAGRICETYAVTHGRHSLTSYLGVSGSNPESHDGIFYSGSRVRMDSIRDGTSNTLMVGERGIPSDLELGWLMCAGGEMPDYSGNMDNLLSTRDGISRGSDDGSHNNHFWSHHRDQLGFALADGSVRTLSEAISHPVLTALSTVNSSDHARF